MPLDSLASSLLDRGDVLARRGVNIDDVVEVVREVHELTRPIDRHAPRVVGQGDDLLEGAEQAWSLAMHAAITLTRIGAPLKDRLASLAVRERRMQASPPKSARSKLQQISWDRRG